MDPDEIINYGGYMVELGPEMAHGQWSEAEALLSSTWRELKAVYLVLLSFAEKYTCQKEGLLSWWFCKLVVRVSRVWLL